MKHKQALTMIPGAKGIWLDHNWKCACTMSRSVPVPGWSTKGSRCCGLSGVVGWAWNRFAIPYMCAVHTGVRGTQPPPPPTFRINSQNERLTGFLGTGLQEGSVCLAQTLTSSSFRRLCPAVVVRSTVGACCYVFVGVGPTVLSSGAVASVAGFLLRGPGQSPSLPSANCPWSSLLAWP